MKERFNFIHNRHTCSLLALIFMYNTVYWYCIVYTNPFDSQINYKNISGDIRFSDNNPVFPVHWTTEATKYCIMSPAPPVAASLYLLANNI
jgi:hypothetical protein